MLVAGIVVHGELLMIGMDWKTSDEVGAFVQTALAAAESCRKLLKAAGINPSDVVIVAAGGVRRVGDG